MPYLAYLGQFMKNMRYISYFKAFHSLAIYPEPVDRKTVLVLCYVSINSDTVACSASTIYVTRFH